MAARQDILNLEADRKESASWNIIHMFKEGSFWHAYEWSAWLICVITYNNEKHKRENTGDPIAVVHKPIGGKNQQGTYTMVGFQIKSLDKFVPNRVKLETIDDKQMDIEIELPYDDTPLTYERLGLQLHHGKTHVVNISHGVEFLGAFVKPYRTYISNKTVVRMKQNIRNLNTKDKMHTSFSVNSYLGVLSHSASYNLRKRIFLNSKVALTVEFDDAFLKSKPQTTFRPHGVE